MNRIRFAPAATMVALLIPAAAALAQYTGPGARSDQPLPVARTVAEVLRKPVDDQHVVLTGTLVRQTGRETYLFRDATGEIQVEIDREDFPAGERIAADTQLVIEGEVDARFMRTPEIDVERLRPLAAPATPTAPTPPAR